MNSKFIVALVLCAVLLLVSAQGNQSSGAGRVVIFRARTQPISPIKRVAKKHTGNGLPKNIPVVSKQTGGLVPKQAKKPKKLAAIATSPVVKTAIKKLRNAGSAKKASVSKKAKKGGKKPKRAGKKLNNKKKRTASKKSKKTGKKARRGSKKGKKARKGKKSAKKCDKKPITATEHKRQIAKISRLLGGKKTAKKCLTSSHVKKALRVAKKHSKLAKKVNKKASKRFAQFANKFKKQVTANFKKLAGCKKAKKAKKTKKVRKCTKKQTYLEVLEKLRTAHNAVRNQIEEWAKPVRSMDAKARKAAINAMKQRIPREFHHYLKLANGNKTEGKLVEREDKREIKVDNFVANSGKNNKTSNSNASGPIPFSGFQIKVHVD